jgi:hypothetical protein
MNSQNMSRALMGLALALCAGGSISAQTGEQVINVRVLPSTTVEERVTNDLKEKELRKAAEEAASAREAARVGETNPKALLSRARVLYIDSNTTYFESVQLQNALRKHDEMDAWQMAMVDGWDKRKIADVIIEIDRPFFTYTFTYKITHQHTGIILATGKVTAFDGTAAAPMLAQRIVEEIRKSRGEAKPRK